MTDLIDRIGPYVGVAAFLGLAFLAFLVIQQAREVRRLREWAGRAPERARDAADASTALADAKGEEAPEPEIEEPDPSGFARWLHGVRDWMSGRAAEVDRRLPVHPRYILAVIAAAVIAAAVLTSGFGIFGGDDSSTGNGKGSKPEKVEVAVLNATQVEDTVTGDPIAGVQGLAGVVAKKVVKPAGFKIAAKTDATSGLDQTVIMFEPGHEADATKLADAAFKKLGQTDVTPMIGEVRDLAKKAPLALVIGADDSDFGAGSGETTTDTTTTG
jgi:LytR cell envelope-related transcriptional attenuator